MEAKVNVATATIDRQLVQDEDDTLVGQHSGLFDITELVVPPLIAGTRS